MTTKKRKKKSVSPLERAVARETTSRLRRVLNSRKTAEDKINAIRVLFEAVKAVQS